MFWKSEITQGRRTPEPVNPRWETLVLVCEKCRGAKHGPDASGIRKGIKHRLGKNKQLRVLESACMGICPDDAVTVCVSRTTRAAEVVIVRSDSELDVLADSLRE